MNLLNFNIGFDTLRFGTSASALTDQQLGRINFPAYIADLDQNGYVIFTPASPVPEPGVVSLFILGGLTVAFVRFGLRLARGEFMKTAILRMLFLLGALTLLFPGALSLQAQPSELWSGTINQDFHNPQNWYNKVVPDNPFFCSGRSVAVDFGPGITVSSFSAGGYSVSYPPFGTSIYNESSPMTFGAGPIGSQTLTLKDGGKILSHPTWASSPYYFNSKIILGETGGEATYLIDGILEIRAPISGGSGGFAGEKVLTFSVLGCNVYGEISDGGSQSLGVFVKESYGSALVLHAKNTYTGDTVIGQNGALSLAIEFAISQLSDVTLARSSQLRVEGFDQSFGKLSLFGAPPFSDLPPIGNVWLDFGFGAGLRTDVSFADSHDLEWIYQLALRSFDIGLDTLRFGTSDTALTDEQLSLIYLPGYSADLDQNGYVVFTAVPEPHTVGLFVLGFLAVAGGSLVRSTRRSTSGASKIA